LDGVAAAEPEGPVDAGPINLYATVSFPLIRDF